MKNHQYALAIIAFLLTGSLLAAENATVQKPDESQTPTVLEKKVVLIEPTVDKSGIEIQKTDEKIITIDDADTQTKADALAPQEDEAPLVVEYEKTRFDVEYPDYAQAHMDIELAASQVDMNTKKPLELRETARKNLKETIEKYKATIEKYPQLKDRVEKIKDELL